MSLLIAGGSLLIGSTTMGDTGIGGSGEVIAGGTSWGVPEGPGSGAST